MPSLRAVARIRSSTTRRLTRWAIAVAIAATPAMAGAQENAPAFLRDAERQLEDGRSTLDEATLAAARRSFESCVRDDDKNSRCYYDLGRTDRYLVDANDRRHDGKAAQRAIDSGIDNTRRSIALNDGFADAHALLADLYGIKIGHGGMLTGMRYGPKAEAEANRALQLDPDNARARLVFGRRQLYAPKLFGGDIDKAVASFRQATTLDPRLDEGFVLLSMAYAKKGDTTAARTAIDEALRLNGRNIVAQELRSAMK
jgi:tetratricopeptide (TPR) repeat protein